LLRKTFHSKQIHNDKSSLFKRLSMPKPHFIGAAIMPVSLDRYQAFPPAAMVDSTADKPDEMSTGETVFDLFRKMLGG